MQYKKTIMRLYKTRTQAKPDWSYSRYNWTSLLPFRSETVLSQAPVQMLSMHELLCFP